MVTAGLRAGSRVSNDQRMRAHRLLLAMCAMVWAASLTVLAARFVGTSDFAIVWTGARGLLDGQNPYELVGPDRPFHWAYPLVYPFTAIVVGVPFALVPLPIANALFAAAGAGLMAWGLTRDRLHDPRLLVFVSLPFFHAGLVSQWSPLLVGAALVPAFGWLLACKPTIGLPLLLWRPSRLSFILAGAMVVVSFAIWPTWPLSWRTTLATVPHITAPVLLPWGWLLLAPLVFWNYPPARFLVLLACLPQSPLFYEAVLLFLVVRTWGEATWLWLTTLLVWRFMPINVADPSNVYEVLPAGATKMLWGAYLPALAVVMRQGWQERTWAAAHFFAIRSRLAGRAASTARPRSASDSHKPNNGATTSPQ